MFKNELAQSLIKERRISLESSFKRNATAEEGGGRIFNVTLHSTSGKVGPLDYATGRGEGPQLERVMRHILDDCTENACPGLLADLIGQEAAEFELSRLD